MDLPIRVNAFDEHGIKVIPSTYADFDELARPLIGRVADIGLKLKPMLMIVSNESPQTVVACSQTWTAQYSGGRTSVMRGHTSFPETVCGDILISNDPAALPRQVPKHFAGKDELAGGIGRQERRPTRPPPISALHRVQRPQIQRARRTPTGGHHDRDDMPRRGRRPRFPDRSLPQERPDIHRDLQGHQLWTAQDRIPFREPRIA
jgi:hypothetical protein